MADEHESRAGAFSGVVAGIMVIALTAMVFTAFGPEQPARTFAAAEAETQAPSAPADSSR
ncbi:MAG TPA: hypothetical protein VEA80_18020 [Vitreimonas sp.]|uniref:hypothetical protein n=1 Tax=Vitreimonas sp. TaxID=3069702 RepID=UPI002D2BD4EA|nr:hypothetical protein [Vitreimonas sp.]HYD89381.1 hypothetical protein [Vitreimonas sp.]